MVNESLNKIQKIKSRMFLPNITSESIMLGILLAIVGGFLDAYTFIGRGGVFSNAQTGNIVLVGINAFEGNWHATIIHIFPIVAFIFGVLAAEFTKKNFSVSFLSKWEHAVLVFEIIIFFIIGFMPKNFSNNCVNITISFAASLQYCAFKNLSGYPYATTMCTGNLRSASQAAYLAFTQKDYDAAIKALHYFTVIFAFFLGTFLGGFLTFFIGDKSVWFVVILLIFSLVLLEVTENTRVEATLS